MSRSSARDRCRTCRSRSSSQTAGRPPPSVQSRSWISTGPWPARRPGPPSKWQASANTAAGRSPARVARTCRAATRPAPRPGSPGGGTGSGGRSARCPRSGSRPVARRGRPASRTNSRPSERHVPPEQVEQRRGGLAADRVAGQPEDGPDAGIGLDGQVAPDQRGVGAVDRRPSQVDRARRRRAPRSSAAAPRPGPSSRSSLESTAMSRGGPGASSSGPEARGATHDGRDWELALGTLRRRDRPRLGAGGPAGGGTVETGRGRRGPDRLLTPPDQPDHDQQEGQCGHAPDQVPLPGRRSGRRHPDQALGADRPQARACRRRSAGRGPVARASGSGDRGPWPSA